MDGRQIATGLGKTEIAALVIFADPIHGSTPPCGTGFGDEMHLVFECAAMTDLRGQFPYIFQPHQTMQQFMWQSNLLQVAKFLDAGMKRLQTVDPDEGSNI